VSSNSAETVNADRELSRPETPSSSHGCTSEDEQAERATRQFTPEEGRPASTNATSLSDGSISPADQVNHSQPPIDRQMPSTQVRQSNKPPIVGTEAGQEFELRLRRRRFQVGPWTSLPDDWNPNGLSQAEPAIVQQSVAVPIRSRKQHPLCRVMAMAAVRNGIQRRERREAADRRTGTPSLSGARRPCPPGNSNHKPGHRYSYAQTHEPPHPC